MSRWGYYESIQYGLLIIYSVVPLYDIHSKPKYLLQTPHRTLARYVKLRIAHAPGMPGTFSQPPRVSDPDMHHGTCVMHVPWCMPRSLTIGVIWSRWRENVPSIPGALATRNFTYLVRGPKLAWHHNGGWVFISRLTIWKTTPSMTVVQWQCDTTTRLY